jgi:hypothetical protein
VTRFLSSHWRGINYWHYFDPNFWNPVPHFTRWSSVNFWSLFRSGFESTQRFSKKIDVHGRDFLTFAFCTNSFPPRNEFGTGPIQPNCEFVQNAVGTEDVRLTWVFAQNRLKSRFCIYRVCKSMELKILLKSWHLLKCLCFLTAKLPICQSTKLPYTFFIGNQVCDRAIKIALSPVGRVYPFQWNHFNQFTKFQPHTCSRALPKSCHGTFWWKEWRITPSVAKISSKGVPSIPFSNKSNSATLQ